MKALEQVDKLGWFIVSYPYCYYIMINVSSVLFCKPTDKVNLRFTFVSDEFSNSVSSQRFVYTLKNHLVWVKKKYHVLV